MSMNEARQKLARDLERASSPRLRKERMADGRFSIGFFFEIAFFSF